MKKVSLKRALSGVLAAVMLVSTAFVGTASAAYETDDSCVWGIVPGDANGNGTVNIDDVVLVLKYIAGWKKAKKDLKIEEANVDGDSGITIKDALKLMKYIAGYSSVRLCHDDTVELVSEASDTEYGVTKVTCKKCGSTDTMLSPKTSKTSLFNIKGVELSEYTIVYGDCPGDSTRDIAYAMSDALFNITGLRLSVSTAKSTFEHEFLLGDTGREGVPELDPKNPCAGMLENGNIYFIAYTSAMVRYFVDEFIQVNFGGGFGATLGRDIPRNPWGEECNEWESVVTKPDLEADGYSLEFEDEFEGDSLDYDVWEDRGLGVRRDGVNAHDAVSVKDGNLVITGDYRQASDGNMYWHAGMLALKKWYCRGYYEIKAKCCDPSYGFWSAFWIQGKDPYIPNRSQGGTGYGGAEIDILENNCVFGNTRHNIYCAGTEGFYCYDGCDPDNSVCFGGYNSESYYIGDVENEYHTYSLLWDEDWYTFYVDDIPVGRTSFGDGTSVVDEQVIISMEIGSNMPKPEDEDFDEYKDKATEYTIDYLRIYQK